MQGRLASRLLAIAVICVAVWEGGPARHASPSARETVGLRSAAESQLRVADIKCEMVIDPDDTDPDAVRVPVTRSGPGAVRTAPHPTPWQGGSRARQAGAGGSRVAQLTCVFELSDPGADGDSTTTGAKPRHPTPRGPQAT